ncbi:phosphatidylinositol-3,5-bisphosphate 3-phosphatase MTMR4 isoform X2 [Chironomus tepperi]|uniref:phosphatidylinositol-3,5-bisphosphate 3-phosphatase MTMR4 isoform X2 n=1 Tax=Chironomus tepperi TaxID=113505 RepID=UPI00391F8F76
MDETEDSPSSLWMIRAAELFPKVRTEREEANLQVPFNELPGESVKYIGKCENGMLAISNYRLYLSNSAKSFETSIPLRVIEGVATKDIFQLIISCKDSVTYVCYFSSNESCTKWHSRISDGIDPPNRLESLFAFSFHAWVSESTTCLDQEWFNRLQHATEYDEYFERELERLQYDLKGIWRVSTINSEFNICPSYPKKYIVPACMSDEALLSVSNFRSAKRIPIVTWRHHSGAILSRSSQPEVGWLGWRNSNDEMLLQAFVDACSLDNGKNLPKTKLELGSSETSQTENVVIDKPKKLLIVDARSYASAVTNRARGGGVECTEYYPSSEIQFMNLGNIHVIRRSFQNLRTLCALDIDSLNWYSLLEKTNWLQHISGILCATNIVCRAIEKNHRPVLIHCSDGWDRTPQLTATTQICLDPFYRTIEGFKILVEKEWLCFGHKFGDRIGHGVGSFDGNERCPVFLQWLDVIQQIHHQYPCSFEFSKGYLTKLAQHIHSCLFGTFLCNTYKERLDNTVFDRTFSVWPFLSSPIYKNPLYQPNRDKVLWPSHNLRNLVFWNDFYLGSFHTPHDNGNSEISNDITYGLIKTRSFDDLLSEIKSKENSTRRLSDPSIVFGDNNMPLTVSIFLENSSSSSAANNNINHNNTINQQNSISNTKNKIDLIKIMENGNKVGNGENRELKCDVESKEIINGNSHHDDENGTENDKISENTVNDKIEGEKINGNGQNVPYDDSSREKDEAIEIENKISGDINVKGACTMPITIDNLEQHLRRTKLNYPSVNGHKNGIDSKKESTSSNDSQPSTPALRSTTPALLDRNFILPDGLSHALSQENLRLQQLVFEHKLKEEALQNELYLMRLALLKSTSCQCNNQQNTKTNSANMSEDAHPECNSENSICSWEAVEEKCGPAITPWIPDHARSKCKNCQIEFWLGRRKHHCRFCKEIFCADCSDNFAQLPNEACQPPVRLCESCFKSITDKDN